VACALFGSAAWKCADRDAFLGWDRPTRERNLQRLTNNTRFLIPGWPPGEFQPSGGQLLMEGVLASRPAFGSRTALE
jgi:hypothetical protein